MCWKCGKNIEEEIISRSSECPVCSADLHSCRNCSFYDEQSHYECRETVEELVKDKERANFCSYFKVRRAWGASFGTQTNKAVQARKAFDALFG